MTDYTDIPCPLRDDEPPYAYCHDDKGKRSQTLRVAYDPVNEITSFQCKTRPKEHRFKLDREGNIVGENGRCKNCD